MRIYLDHNATTPPDPRVLAAMAQAASERWGNPSSLHTEGRAARDAIERARKQVLGLLEPATSVPAGQLIFTSGGTEANNTAIAGLGGTAGPGAPLITSPLEHPSVLAAAARRGPVTYLPVDDQGLPGHEG